jgi:PAS domain S-box-containing protein
MNNASADKNRRVLVIDDNRAIHDDFRKILSPATAMAAASDATEKAVFGRPTDAVQQTQFEVASAYQGQEGLLLVKQALEAGRPYALAFVDVRMPPGWDGVETTRRIWELDPDLQVVLCTAYSDYSWDELFEKLGQRDGLLILKKPFDAVEAVQLAHALTEKWWLHQQSRRKMEELEIRVAERTRELQRTNHALQQQHTEGKRAAEALRESEERFSGAFEHAPIGVALVSPDGRWLKVNRALCALVGYSQAELLTLTYQDITHPEDLEVDRENVRRTLAGEIRSYQMEKRYVHQRGHFVTSLLNVSLVRDGQGQPLYFIAQIQDITERKRAEAALTESRGLYHSLVEQLPANVWRKDAEGRFIFANSRFCRSKGKTVDEILGQTASTINSKEVADQVTKEHELIMRTGKSIEKEESYTQPDGTVQYLLVMKGPVAADGRIVGSQGIQFDITHRKRLEAQLVQSHKMETVGKLA